ncbi:uncharacterized protein [Watersipora subatra]|uniref:uncharacterized protein n=1 Tax=Watersipora subatra TaxID=2589382 RepID=UPI00355C23D7
MPIKSFNRLAECMPENRKTVLWVYHTGRCGSTALSQAFNALPNAVAMSEPLCFISLLQSFSDKELSYIYNLEVKKQYRKLFQSIVRVLLKPSLKDADILVIKHPAFDSLSHIDLVAEFFPEFKIIFMYRDAKPQISSLYRAIGNTDMAVALTKVVSRNAVLSNLFPFIKPIDLEYDRCYICEEHIEWLYAREKKRPICELGIFSVGYSETCYHYRQAVQNKLMPIMAFKYELFRNNLQQLAALFDHMELRFTEEQSSLMHKALELDSQEHSDISRALVAKKQVTITPSMIAEANESLEYFGLPKWGESITLPNTVN